MNKNLKVKLIEASLLLVELMMMKVTMLTVVACSVNKYVN